ncbi:MAG: integration host factor subunit beta [Acidobacteria bacterium]|nr:integration host factor subunit beta [Acidobacteriota bacterium]
MPTTKKETTKIEEVKEAKSTNKKRDGIIGESSKLVNKVNKVNKVNREAKTKAYPKVKKVEPKPNTISRSELAQSVAKAVGQYMEITNRDAESIVSEIISTMVDSLKNSEEIEIRGFGSFRLRTRRARRGRNPKTGESVDVASKQIVYFKQGKDLKEFLKQK